MDVGSVASIATVSVLILGGLGKISRQVGRIEAEVMGLNDRVQRLERRADRERL